jgi:aminopeptidase N
VLHMLRWVMGDSDFFQVLRSYAADPRFAYKNANSVQFQEVCESFYGEPLDWFFDQWLHEEGEPQYTWTAGSTSDGGATKTYLTIEQVQPGFIYTMPLEVRFTMASGDTSVVVWNTTEFQQYTINMPGPVSAVSLDPDGWVLGDKTRRKLGGAHVAVSPNPFSESVAIDFETSVSGQADVKIYDVTGARVITLHEGELPPAFHRLLWDGRNGRGDPVSKGVYFVEVTSVEGRATNRIVFIQ